MNNNTNRARQAELRLRRYKAGLVELRGIWATPAQAEVIRELAKAVTGQPLGRTRPEDEYTIGTEARQDL